MKTGECYFKTENGDLWLAESFINEDDVTYTIQTFVGSAELEIIN